MKKHEIAIAGGMGELRSSTFRIGSMEIISKKEVLATVNALEDALYGLGMDVKKGVGTKAAEKVFR